MDRYVFLPSPKASTDQAVTDRRPADNTIPASDAGAVILLTYMISFAYNVMAFFNFQLQLAHSMTNDSPGRPSRPLRWVGEAVALGGGTGRRWV
jgi:hypothetical protein